MLAILHFISKLLLFSFCCRKSFYPIKLYIWWLLVIQHGNKLSEICNFSATVSPLSLHIPCLISSNFAQSLSSYSVEEHH